MAENRVPARYPAFTPYLVVWGAGALLRFMEEVFGAEVRTRQHQPDGSVMHAEVTFGDSLLMVGEPMGEFTAMPTHFYLMVDDVDAVYERALQAGASSVEAPDDQAYGHRRAAVKDLSGNYWWLAAEEK